MSGAEGDTAMNIAEARARIEKHMLTQANSVGELLEQCRSRISPQLIDGVAWEKLLERAYALPMSLATSGFGFEFPLHEHEPRADLGLALFEGSRSAAHFEEWSRSQPEDPSTMGVLGLLREMGREESTLRRLAATKLLLEYDIRPARPDPFPDPGIFLYPNADEGSEAGFDPTVDDVAVIADAVVAASRWEADAAERRHVERLFLAKPPDTEFGAVGAFPARARGLRAAITGFRTTRDLTAFLARTEWPGQPEAVGSFVSDFEERGAFAHLAAHMDIHAEGLGLPLGVSFYARESQWVTNLEPWTKLLHGLRDQGLAVPEKVVALEKSCSGAETMFGRRGVLLFVRGIHHIKAVLVGDRVEQVKAYVFFLVFPPFQNETTPAA